VIKRIEKREERKMNILFYARTAKPALTVRIGVLLLAAALWNLCSPAMAQKPPVESSLTAHEWGTFTSIAGRDGQATRWLPLNGSTDLPSFVEHFRNAGFKVGLSGTVRMETPVLYFYSNRDLTLSVHVAFSRGLITEWYPQASRVTPAENVKDASLYEKSADGSIAWDSVSLAPNLAPDFPRDVEKRDAQKRDVQKKDDGQANRYYAARQTSATPLRVPAASGEQHEKFLFYRGVSAFSVPISAKFTREGNLLVKNLIQQPIPGLILFERRGDKVGYRISSELADETTLQPPELTASVDTLYTDLQQMLLARGLYPDEAHAMLETWKNSWFEEGSRLFYLVPSQFVDSILPLTIHPAPAQTVRVFVGRLELISPATKLAVATASARHDTRTLAKYGRFLGPILEAIGPKSSALARPIRESPTTDCDF
jgi:hypothetical protein